MNIIHAIHDRDIFGSLPAFKNLDTWKSWIVWHKVINALPLDLDELQIFRKCTGRQNPPTKPARDIFSIVARRGGKTFNSALEGAFLAGFSDYRPYLNTGERAAVLLLARDRDQSGIAFDYVSGIIHSVPVLEAMIEVERSDEIELSNGVIILVKPSDYRAVRGLTVAVCILDELSFWDEGDREVITALRPAMATIPNSRLMAISTPYTQAGFMYEIYRDYFGKDDPDILVWKADTATMNPTVSRTIIDKALALDPDSASSEWLGEFRSDLKAAFSPENVEACVINGRDELPASPLIKYSSFCDPSGGKADAFTLAIGHKENEIAVIDKLSAWWPPFDPLTVVSEISDILKAYSCSNVTGDNYAGSWPDAAFREHGIGYEKAEKVKSDLYLGFIPTVNSKRVELPDDKQLVTQLKRLQRKRGRSGKDTVDHPPHGRDDLSNAVAGLSYLLNSETTTNGFNASKHVSDVRFLPGKTVYIGLTLNPPICSVIAQRQGDSVAILAAFAEGGLQQHVTQYLRPWLADRQVPSIRLRDTLVGCYDNFDMSMAASYELTRTVEELIGGRWNPPFHPWQSRRESMIALIQKAQKFTFEPLLRVSKEAGLVPAALGRPWDIKDRSVYSGIANACSLVCSAIEPVKTDDKDDDKPLRQTWDARFT